MTLVTKYSLFLFVLYLLLENGFNDAAIPPNVIDGWRRQQNIRTLEQKFNDGFMLQYAKGKSTFNVEGAKPKEWCDLAAPRFLSKYYKTVNIKHAVPYPNTKNKESDKAIRFNVAYYFQPTVSEDNFVLCVAECLTEDLAIEEVAFYGTRHFGKGYLWTSYALDGDVDGQYLLTGGSSSNSVSNEISIIADLGDWQDNDSEKNRDPPTH